MNEKFDKVIPQEELKIEENESHIEVVNQYHDMVQYLLDKYLDKSEEGIFKLEDITLARDNVTAAFAKQFELESQDISVEGFSDFILLAGAKQNKENPDKKDVFLGISSLRDNGSDIVWKSKFELTDRVIISQSEVAVFKHKISVHNGEVECIAYIIYLGYDGKPRIIDHGQAHIYGVKFFDNVAKYGDTVYLSGPSNDPAYWEGDNMIAMPKQVVIRMYDDGHSFTKLTDDEIVEDLVLSVNESSGLEIDPKKTSILGPYTSNLILIADDKRKYVVDVVKGMLIKDLDLSIKKNMESNEEEPRTWIMMVTDNAIVYYDSTNEDAANDVRGDTYLFDIRHHLPGDKGHLLPNDKSYIHMGRILGTDELFFVRPSVSEGVFYIDFYNSEENEQGEAELSIKTFACPTAPNELILSPRTGKLSVIFKMDTMYHSMVYFNMDNKLYKYTSVSFFSPEELVDKAKKIMSGQIMIVSDEVEEELYYKNGILFDIKEYIDDAEAGKSDVDKEEKHKHLELTTSHFTNLTDGVSLDEKCGLMTFSPFGEFVSMLIGNVNYLSRINFRK